MPITQRIIRLTGNNTETLKQLKMLDIQKTNIICFKSYNLFWFESFGVGFDTPFAEILGLNNKY